MKELLVVANGRAGSAQRQARETTVQALRNAANVHVVDLDDPSELGTLLERYAGRTPVVMGGDGSVHLMVAALHDLGRLDAGPPELGVVPAGTGNDLARTLGLPLNPADAARVVLEGRGRPLDVLTDDAGGVVVNALHLGVGADAARRATPLKKWLRRFAYPVGSLIAGIMSRGWKVRVTVDGDVVADGRRRVLMVALGNGMTIGGGARVAPEAAPDDGQVDVVVSFSITWRARVAFALDFVRGRHPHRPDVVVRRGREVVIDGEPVPMNADGELSELRTSRTWTVRRHALRVLVPR